MILISDKYVWDISNTEIDKVLKDIPPNRQIDKRQLSTILQILSKTRKPQEIPALLRGALGSGI